MNNNKAAKILNIIFSFLFSVIFLRLLYMILAIGYQNNTERNTYDCSFEDYISIIITGIVLTFIFSAVYYAIHACNLHKIRRKITDSKKQTRIIIFAGVGVMLVLQLAAAYFLATEPVTDLSVINRYAESFARTGNLDLIQKDASKEFIYMIRYPNNLALMFILSFLYRVDFLITGYVSNYIAVILNTLAINASVLMAVLLAQKLFGNKKALMTLVLCMLFLPYYTYTPYYYTDSLSMPFFVGGIYLFFSALKSERKYKKYVLMLICGALLMLGFKVKGSVAILLAVAVVYMLLKCSIKRFACFALALLIGFGSVYGAYTMAYRASNIITPEQCDYMMDMMYSTASLTKQMKEDGHTYLIYTDEQGKDVGYVSVQPLGDDVVELQKIYVLPDCQGHGLGKLLFNEVITWIKQHCPTPCRVELHVNRYNRALHFYEHLGMRKLRQGDYDIGNGYFMNDYIMGLDIA